MEPGPLSDLFDDLLFDRIADEVLHPHPGLGLIGDGDGGVGPRPELLAPVVVASELPGEIGIEVAHEARRVARRSRARPGQVVVLCGVPDYVELLRIGPSKATINGRWQRIIMGFPEIRQPSEELSPGKGPSCQTRWQLDRGEGLLLHPEVDFYVAMGGVEGGVAKPSCNGRDVDIGLQEVHRSGVADDVGRDASCPPWFELGPRSDRAEDVGDTRARESEPLTVDEERAWVRTALCEPLLDGDDGLLPERTGSLSAPLSVEGDEGDGTETEACKIEIDELLDPCSGVVEQEHQGAISPIVTGAG